MGCPNRRRSPPRLSLRDFFSRPTDEEEAPPIRFTPLQKRACRRHAGAELWRMMESRWRQVTTVHRHRSCRN